MEKNLKILKEFEYLTKCNSLLSNEEQNNDKSKQLSKKQYEELEKFIKSQDSIGVDGEPLDFFKVFTKKGIGDVIQARNFVGLLELDSGLQIEILPKIEFLNGEIDQTKKVFINMLKSMREFPAKVFTPAKLNIDTMSIYEIFINMFVNQVSILTHKGLKSEYLHQEENLSFLKGKLLLNQHIKINMAHAEKFYVSYDEFHLNRPENRLIKSTLQHLLKKSINFKNKKAIKQQLSYFDLVESSTNFVSDFESIKIDRNNKEYEDLILWAKVFLMNMSFSTFSGATKAHSLLFPMEKVFESYVSEKLKHIWSSKGYQVFIQEKEKYLLKEEQRNVFALKPDILIKDSFGRRIIMDTKWKRLSASKFNYGISQGDIYQMFAYSKKYKVKDIWMLYPVVEELNDRIIEFKDEEETRINVFFIDVSKIEDSLKKLLNRVEEKF